MQIFNEDGLRWIQLDHDVPGRVHSLGSESPESLATSLVDHGNREI